MQTQTRLLAGFAFLKKLEMKVGKLYRAKQTFNARRFQRDDIIMIIFHQISKLPSPGDKKSDWLGKCDWHQIKYINPDGEIQNIHISGDEIYFMLEEIDVNARG
jgi:hypothetical protein